MNFIHKPFPALAGVKKCALQYLIRNVVSLLSLKNIKFITNSIDETFKAKHNVGMDKSKRHKEELI